MSVNSPRGFWANGVSCNLKKDGLDLAVVRNLGPKFDFAGVFTTNEVKAAPVLWSEQIVKTKKAKAIILNSGGANACTGPLGFSVTHRTAESLAEKLEIAPIDVAVCSTGIIGELLDFEKIESGITEIITTDANSGENAALAIMTTDSRPKQVSIAGTGFMVGGMAKGAGMLAPSMATMLAVLTTDADVVDLDIQSILSDTVETTFNRISADGCTSTNDTVLLMANGASGIKPTEKEFRKVLTASCTSLAEQLILDAEGATLLAEILVSESRNEDQALKIARKVAADSLVKTALFGRDPNWGRVAAAVGSAGAGIDPQRLDIYINGEPLCLNGEANGERHRVSLSGDRVQIRISLNLGNESATIFTTDLSTEYVLENSEYSS